NFRPLWMVKEQLGFIQQVMDSAEMIVGLGRVTPLSQVKGGSQFIHGPVQQAQGRKLGYSILRLLCPIPKQIQDGLMGLKKNRPRGFHYRARDRVRHPKSLKQIL